MSDRSVAGAAAYLDAAQPTRPQRPLPTPLAPLIGRQSELDQIRRLVLREDVRLISLLGPGGVGKTRLALEVANDVQDHFPDGAFVVWLAPLRDPTLVLPAIARTLGLREEGTYPLVDTLADYLWSRQLLLVLDNLEHLLEAVPDLVGLLTVCPRLKILATSRAALDVVGEHEHHVPPLALPDLSPLPDLGRLAQVDAVRLFVERAQAVQSSFALTPDNAPSVAAICHRLDGLPLAVELAAARVRIFPPQALLARLTSRLPFLTGGPDLPERHRTMRATIAWSYDLLSPSQRTLFSRLSVFAGGCSLEAIEAVCGSSDGPTDGTSGEPADDLGAEVLGELEALVARSLVQQEETPVGPRFSMLETVREYGLECLGLSDEAEAIRERHAEHYLGLAESAEAAAAEAEDVHQGYQPPGWLARLARDEDNFRGAHDWAIEREHAVVALRLGAALWRYWYFRGHLSEGRQRLDEALQLSPPSRDEAYLRARANALEAAGLLAQLQGDYRGGLDLLSEGLAVARELGDRPLTGRLLQWGGMAAFHLGEITQSAALLDESIEASRATGSRELAARALRLRALVAHHEGDLTLARSLLDENALLPRESGRRPNDEDLVILAFVMVDQGDVATGRAILQELLEFERARGFRRGVGSTTLMVGIATLAAGEVDEARALMEEGLVTWHSAGEWGGRAWVIACCAEWAAAAGKAEAAAWLARAAGVLWKKGGAPVSPWLQAFLSRVVRRLGQSHDGGSEARPTEEELVTFESAFAYALETLRNTGLAKAASAAPSIALLYGRLSRRELEVARLIAEGLPNREIAERLVLAERTVTTHVEHIFQKLGYHSRAQVAAWIGAGRSMGSDA